jgi:hypothetical protein
MKEILLSYNLLFRDDRSSRVLYRAKERSKSSFSTVGLEAWVDPVLDRACGFDLPTSIFSFDEPVRETYHPESDFPMLRERLLKLHYFMDGIQPTRMAALWRDRRDLTQWYTLWTLIIVGGYFIIQSIISILLAAVQVAIARKSLELQERQSSQSIM